MNVIFKISHTAEGVKMRVNLVRSIALATMSDLKSKAEIAYKDMDDWLGSRFLKEMDRLVYLIKKNSYCKCNFKYFFFSIKYLTAVMKHAIESGTKIREELEIDQDQFVISEVGNNKIQNYLSFLMKNGYQKKNPQKQTFHYFFHSGLRD